MIGGDEELPVNEPASTLDRISDGLRRARSQLAAHLAAAGEIGQIDRFNIVTSPVLPYSFAPRQAKSRGRVMQRERISNKEGMHRPHQGKQEMARRVRNIALGRYNKEQLA